MVTDKQIRCGKQSKTALFNRGNERLKVCFAWIYQFIKADSGLPRKERVSELQFHLNRRMGTDKADSQLFQRE